MTRAALEHIIRAAGTLADVEDLVVIGSQAVLGEFPGAPAELLVSNEADVFPLRSQERSVLIDSGKNRRQDRRRYHARVRSDRSAACGDGIDPGHPGIGCR
jgi:hypothetical protein